MLNMHEGKVAGEVGRVGATGEGPQGRQLCWKMRNNHLLCVPILLG